jgi:Spy/CpxP family protein refolding chaperone
MTKLIAVLAAGLFATGSLFAGQNGDCMKQASNHGKMACEASTASLNLTPAQQTKMHALMAEHHKEGCTKASEAEYMQKAKGILNKDQYAKFKAECKAGDKGKTQA